MNPGRIRLSCLQLSDFSIPVFGNKMRSSLTEENSKQTKEPHFKSYPSLHVHRKIVRNYAPKRKRPVSYHFVDLKMECEHPYCDSERNVDKLNT